ncbi:MAG: sigma-54-dependent Fis family transcriptional regulator [Deltaproteobacteria bacterium]|nr:sigma-54-dependent Fis family transcriptional regulator [Deltaproteobacteria bacterium]
MAPTVLVVDDDPSNLSTLTRILVREGYEVRSADNGREALVALRDAAVDLVLTDLKMPGMTGHELLRAVKKLSPSVEVVVMTAYGTVETAVEAMKEGAYDFVAKPLKRAELLKVLEKALEKRGLLLENERLRAQLGGRRAEELVGRSPRVQSLLAEVEQVAPSDATVLLTGESGTGKGLLARVLHRASRRAQGPLITVNCAALPETLLESELFGYEKGAFTGASGRKEGRFDLARGGTLFLDEITEMSLPLQVKLLRVLQEGEYERVGGTRTLQVDARIIAATNTRVEELVRDGRFRQDLFYRLNVIRLHAPALREHPEDIPLLAQHFLLKYAEKNRKTLHGFSVEALDAFAGWSWPGNVRELENAVERAVVLARGDAIGLDDLPPPMRGGGGRRKRLCFEVGTPLKVVERQLIEETLRYCEGDKILAASLLGTTARTLYRREADWAGERDEQEG